MYEVKDGRLKFVGVEFIVLSRGVGRGAQRRRRPRLEWAKVICEASRRAHSAQH